MKRIESATNDYIKFLNSLKNDKNNILEYGLFLVEGEHIIIEALELNIVKQILFTNEKLLPTLIHPDVELIQVSDKVIERLSQNKSNRGIIAVAKYFEHDFQFSKFNKVIILDGINNPGNLGTIIRSASAFAFDAVILLNDSTFFLNDKVIKASQGAIFKMPVINLKSTDRLKGFNFYHFILDSKSKEISEVEVKKPFALVFGNEANGISKNTLASLKGENVYIKIHNVESLNVAVAASLSMYNFGK